MNMGNVYIRDVIQILHDGPRTAHFVSTWDGPVNISVSV